MNNEEDSSAADLGEIDIVINNVVSTFFTRCHLNLKKICLKGMNVIYNQENKVVSMKLKKPSVTASIWSSGKITCAGASSEEESLIASRKVARCLWRLGFETKFARFKIVNVLGTVHLPFDILLTEFSAAHPKTSSYEPELHPGVTFKLETPKASLKIFHTGSITIAAPSAAKVKEAMEVVYPLVYEYKLLRPPSPTYNHENITLPTIPTHIHTPSKPVLPKFPTHLVTISHQISANLAKNSIISGMFKNNQRIINNNLSINNKNINNNNIMINNNINNNNNNNIMINNNINNNNNIIINNNNNNNKPGVIMINNSPHTLSTNHSSQIILNNSHNLVSKNLIIPQIISHNFSNNPHVIKQTLPNNNLITLSSPLLTYNPMTTNTQKTSFLNANANSSKGGVSFNKTLLKRSAQEINQAVVKKYKSNFSAVEMCE